MKKLSRRTFGKATIGAGISVLVGGVELRFLQPVQAAGVRPGVAGCSTWGAAAAKATIDYRAMRPTGIIVHHTTNTNSSDYSQSYAYQVARSIQNWHFQRGWIDTGQQFTISRGGWIMEGRHRSLEAVASGAHHVVGAHADGYNTNWVGIECDGLYTSVQPTAMLYENLVALCAWICSQYGIVPGSSTIKGHRDVNATSCPGDQLYAMLPKLRTDIQTAINNGVSTWPLLVEGNVNRRVKAAEHLLVQRGYSVPVDTTFSSTTTTAVKNFQSANGLTADGKIGAMTFSKLVYTVRQGDINEAVKGIQTLLGITADGNFGPGTAAAVKSFQNSRGLTADGIVGPLTWENAFDKPL